jgi:hypothetical protein
MAKAKESVNKSQAIREAQAELPSAKAKEIVAHLEAKGITVTEGLVYQVKKIGKKKGGKKRGPKPKVMTAAPVTKAAPSSNGKLSVGASITLVKSTAEKVGGWAALKEIVEALA